MDNGYIVLRDVQKHFGAMRAVQGVSFTVSQNEFVTLLGPSGCGKTTLLRLMGGLDVPDGGTITVGGEAVDRTAPRDRRTRMVFQQYALFPHMSVARNVEFGLRVRNLPRAEREREVRAALAMVQLSDKIDNKPGELSGGQQQRVALARAIVTRPRVLLLDEPLAALDLQLRKAMQIELKNLQRELGITFIYVTHDQTEALAMSDRIVVMSQGRVEQIGSGREIYDRPATPFVAQFIGEANFLDCRIEAGAGGLTKIGLDDQTFQISGSDMPRRSDNRARFIVRPEHMKWSMEPIQPFSIPCTVQQVLHLGPIERVLVVSGSGRRLMIDTSRAGELVPERRVFVSWPFEAIRWL